MEKESTNNFLYLSIKALGASLQLTNQKTVKGILEELTDTIKYFNKMSAQPENARVFKSRLTFKAISEIFRNMISRDIAYRQKNEKSLEAKDLKVKLNRLTKRLLELCNESKTLIQQHAVNVLRDGMTIMLHGMSECVFHVLKSSHKRGIRI